MLLLLLLWLCAEGIFRILSGSNLIENPRYGTCCIEFDKKTAIAEQVVKTKQNLDVIFLGNSMVDMGIDPETFSNTYASLSGENISAVNFGLLTLSVSPAGKLSQFLARRYHPRLIVYGTTPRDFLDYRGEFSRPLRGDPWILYNTGEFSAAGWLVDNSYAYRYLVDFRHLFNPAFTEQVKFLRENPHTSYGFLPQQGNYQEEENPKTLVEDYEASQRDLVGLKEIISLSNEKTRVVILEMPFDPKFAPYYMKGGIESYESLFVNPIAKILASNDVEFWRTQPEIEKIVPPDAWQSNLHLNINGATEFTRYLASGVYSNHFLPK